MPEDGKFRYELKYVCSTAQLTLMKNQVSSLLMRDSHTANNGSYYVRSLYFDDIDDTYYQETEDGLDVREKIRIRTYNHNTSPIHLEIKKKTNGKTQKLFCSITEQQCRTLMEGKPLESRNDYHPVLQKLNVAIKTRLMTPKVIVEYERIPFVYKNGNVRITMDTNIASTNQTDGFFKKNIPKRPIMPPGQHILEIKFDEFFPSHIYKSINLENLRQTAFSKYYLCRKYALGVCSL